MKQSLLQHHTKIALPKPTQERAAELFPYPDPAPRHGCLAEHPGDIDCNCQYCRVDRMRERWQRAHAHLDERGLEPSVGIGSMHAYVPVDYGPVGPIGRRKLFTGRV